MEHRYLFQTKMDLNKSNIYENIKEHPNYKIYGNPNADLAIITYGDGFSEALKVREILTNAVDIKIICLTKITGDRSVPAEVINQFKNVKQIIVIDTSNYQGGLLQAILADMACTIPINGKVQVFSPPFSPCPTSPLLAQKYYPKAPEIAAKICKDRGLSLDIKPYNFDEIHLPMQMDFSKYNLSNTVVL